jgi:hypothetical protein
MNYADRKSVFESVKLFPRLAMSQSKKPRRPFRSLSGPHLKPAGNPDGRDARSSQVRARLLRMILDNEEVRRNDRRPSAS